MNTTRRGFLGLGAGVLAAQCLPAMAEEDRQIWYASEPSGEALLNMPIMKNFHPTVIELKVGAKRPFELLHCSDSHIAWMNTSDLIKADEVELKWYESRRRHFNSEKTPFGTISGNATGLAAAIAYARAKNLPMIHTGDLVDYISDANINYIHHDLKGTKCLYAIGNHEFAGTPRPSPKAEWLKDARERLEPYFPNPFTCHSQVINGVNFVAIDNVGMSKDIFPQQFAAIQKEFAKGMPTVLCYHVPFYTPDLAKFEVDHMPSWSNIKRVEDLDEGWLAACPNKGTEKINGKLVKWLREQKNLKALFCGHIHKEFQTEFCEGVTQYCAGATYFGNAYHFKIS